MASYNVYLDALQDLKEVVEEAVNLEDAKAKVKKYCESVKLDYGHYHVYVADEVIYVGMRR